MKLRVEIEGESYSLDLTRNGLAAQYTLSGAQHAAGSASVAEVMPGVFSVLLGEKSFTVYVSELGGNLEVWTGAARHVVSVADARDRSTGSKVAANGPTEIRAQMPGKVIQVLTQRGASVKAGQGLIVIEAMKMQNEIKAPKDGVVAAVFANEGATVGMGEKLAVIE